MDFINIHSEAEMKAKVTCTHESELFFMGNCNHISAKWMSVLNQVTMKSLAILSKIWMTHFQSYKILVSKFYVVKTTKATRGNDKLSTYET